MGMKTYLQNQWNLSQKQIDFKKDFESPKLQINDPHIADESRITGICNQQNDIY